MPSDNIYAIATAAAKKAGYSDFDEGSDGEKKREEIVLALKRRGMKKATYGANNDQARKTGQRTSVERKPRLNPNKLGVSDILKTKKDNPRKKPNIVAQGRENDLYPTGTQFAAGAKDKSPVKKRFANEEEDNEHQLAVGRRDGETDKLSSPAGSIIQAEHVGAVSKAILKQGLLNILLQKKDDWPHKRFTREEAEKIANSRGLRSAADVTQRSIDEENELEGDAQARLRSKKNTRRRKARKARKNTTTVEDTIPSPEEKTETQREFDMDVSEDKGDIHGGTVPYAPSPQRGGSKRGSKAQKLIPEGDWPYQKAVTKNVKFTERTIKDPRRSDFEPVGSSETRQNTIPRGSKSPSQRGPWTARQPRPDKYKNIDRATVRKAREQGDGKGVDPIGKDPLRGKANKHNERFVNADMGAMSYMAKTHFGSEPVSYDGDREARIKATKDHFKHLLLKTPCVCEQRGVIMAIGMKKSGNGSPLASAEKPVAVMAAEQSGLYSVDGKNLDIDPMANKAPMESVNQTDSATRKASVNIDSRGRNTYIQLEGEPVEGDASEVITGLRKPEKQPKLNRKQRRAAEGKGTKNRTQRTNPGTGSRGWRVRKSEPTICSSKATFNSILEKTYYDDQVLERYKDSENGKNKRKTKSRHITNDITDTAGQQTNKTRGI